MKVLILKPSSLGDVVQALPVLRLIRKHRRDADVFWWIDTSLSPLLEGDPDLAGLIRFDRRGWMSPMNWAEIWRTVQEIRCHAFDWVIDLQSLARSGIVAWLANGDFTVGLDDAREGARCFYDVAVRRPTWDTHAVDWYLQVLPVLGIPNHGAFDWLPVRKPQAAAVREKWAPAGRRLIVLQPGARWWNKRWPLEHFVQLVRRLAAEHADLDFAVLGGMADRSLGEAIRAACPERCLDLTGRTSLLEMVEWIRAGTVMVANDTGPMHVAAAVGVPVVGLFGPTEPRRTGAYGQRDGILQTHLPCVPCMKESCSRALPLECLRSISPEAVLSRLRELLDAPARNRRAPSG
ncbi:MAG TPA: lipopolysaccharide heptosyltransferase II [Methylomirabilota bacterium]|nr:lipopolysaccharide heptosyltransferase II [Methylomirabilota bacterium]